MRYETLRPEEVVFESYNMVVAASYDRFFAGKKEKDLLKELKDRTEELAGHIHGEVLKWEDTPLQELDGLTPAGYFNGIRDLAQAVEVFKKGAVLCDEELPKAFTDSFHTFGEEAVQALIKLAADGASVENEDEDVFLIPLNAIRILGEWKAESAVKPLVSLLLDHAGEHELFAEEIRDALIHIGVPSMDPVIRTLDTALEFKNAHEYLLMALSGVGKDHKSDPAYRSLKSSFSRMDNKALGAACLGEYGDGRAIPALRGYIEKNLGRIDPQTFYEIKSAVQSLGGSVEDLKFK